MMTLVKSSKLNKSALSMNNHYEELLQFLENLTVNPRTILSEEILVFTSEPNLYLLKNDPSIQAVRRELYNDHYYTLIYQTIHC
jgi:hypothetical protein